MTMDRILPPGGLGPKQEPLRREREPVKVKPLVWSGNEGRAPGGFYRLERPHGGDVWIIWSQGYVLGGVLYGAYRQTYPTREAAKAAAQADYEARILAAIEAPAQEPTCWLPTATVEWLMGYDGPACATTTAAHNRPIKSDGGVPLYTTPPDALALVAAAYRDAVRNILGVTIIVAPDGISHREGAESVRRQLAGFIETLTPADAQAALTAIERAAYERGKYKARLLLAGSVKETINNVLLDYRQTEVCDENGDGYPLVDALTLKGHSIDMGIREVESIADTVAGAILALLTQEGR